MRHEDWQNRFWNEMKACDGVSFEYGSHDCILFAAKLADAISVDGRYVDRAKMAFQWDDTRTAASLLQEHRLQELIETVLGSMRRWQELQHGDLVLMLHDNGRGMEQTLGVHDGVQVMVPAARGLTPLWWNEALGGWRIE